MTPHTPPTPHPDTEVLLEAHWGRFIAWCSATGHEPLPATAATIEQFLTQFPGAASTQRLRRRAIRAHHLAAGHLNPLPVIEDRVWPRPSLTDAEADAVGEVLAAIPKYRYPIGLRGRRDAFLIVLLGVLRLTRQQAQAITADDVAVTSIVRIRGTVVPSADDPAACAACAVTRWLRIVGLVWAGFRGDVIGLLDPTKGNLDQHDCEQPLPGQWRRAEQLLLPLDVHGWARTGLTLSSRSMTSIISSRRAAAAAHETDREAVGPVVRQPYRFAQLTLQETYDELGAVDATADEILARITALWSDARALDAAFESSASTRNHQIATDSNR
ncbi:hypothetical protein N8D74_17560 (plasmid) [Curtobacterium flaccumfaciens]|uniref:Core-binding (CB) domain-containing protein n=1 Tax=Curtobacterium poinsettiae TaxID=159612 RepID=A0A9Q9PAJ4_9MICO|nr:hypothetical protein [Curtobacterium flaccumfaciens]MCS6563653.1 hypothetical protein [Curtobacterium flaccumfaciens pv. poinsettiae]UXN16956.1 hypothetical protein N8D76_17400 [Curtobacterium flaccumfaciens pv. poinsettiae]UXN27193.1 hypothetical protein N8D74_17560 [Curtobacterium flaccumfaciens]UYC82771.1 hypothetical protein OE229_17730 [Curtobacterium flaccumfaciens pv. poinsettiae]WQM79084.1 hypothetical protein PCFP21_160 [Curtobacterium flaccumfaciens pv. poinsettiae]